MIIFTPPPTPHRSPLSYPSNFLSFYFFNQSGSVSVLECAPSCQSVISLPWATSLKKTDFPSLSSCQFPRAPPLGARLCSHLRAQVLSGLGLCCQNRCEFRCAAAPGEPESSLLVAIHGLWLLQSLFPLFYKDPGTWREGGVM